MARPKSLYCGAVARGRVQQGPLRRELGPVFRVLLPRRLGLPPPPSRQPARSASSLRSRRQCLRRAQLLPRLGARRRASEGHASRARGQSRGGRGLEQHALLLPVAQSEAPAAAHAGRRRRGGARSLVSGPHHGTSRQREHQGVGGDEHRSHRDVDPRLLRLGLQLGDGLRAALRPEVDEGHRGRDDQRHERQRLNGVGLGQGVRPTRGLEPQRRHEHQHCSRDLRRRVGDQRRRHDEPHLAQKHQRLPPAQVPRLAVAVVQKPQAGPLRAAPQRRHEEQREAHANHQQERSRADHGRHV
mmetsp:Transcript_25923/g.97662  ORF Transcript_25923/g.97662 Transcript_25923/m.97662 type:complete len:300 (-) Transcript_25923:1274-2173(-)